DNTKDLDLARPGVVINLSLNVAIESEARKSGARATRKDSDQRRGATGVGERDQRRRRSRRHRRNERDHLRERKEHQVWLTLDSMKTCGQEEDDIVVVRVVVEAADPRLVRRACLRERGQRKKRGHQTQNDEPSWTHGRRLYARMGRPLKHASVLPSQVRLRSPD